jgi:hypothetical protein
MKTEPLKLVHFPYFQSIMSHRIIFWGNSAERKTGFCIQKKIIIVMAGIKRNCGELFKKYNICVVVNEFLLHHHHHHHHHLFLTT